MMDAHSVFQEMNRIHAINLTLLQTAKNGLKLSHVRRVAIIVLKERLGHGAIGAIHWRKRANLTSSLIPRSRRMSVSEVFYAILSITSAICGNNPARNCGVKVV